MSVFSWLRKEFLTNSWRSLSGRLADSSNGKRDDGAPSREVVADVPGTDRSGSVFVFDC